MMRIGILAKETLFREALACLLDRRGRFEVVAQEDNARELLLQAKKNIAQVLLIDSDNLEADELQFVLGAKTYGEFVIVLLAAEDRLGNFNSESIDRLVSRAAPVEGLYEAINEVGQNVKMPRMLVRERRRGLHEDNLLTRREYEIARLVAQGLSNRRISGISGLREQSVKNLVSVIMRKMQCENRVQVALKLVNSEAAAPRESSKETPVKESPTPVEA